MSKIICFIYTETNGLHKTNSNVSKKNIYAFAKLVALNYMIGLRENNKFKQIKKVRKIIKPKCINFSQEAINYHGISRKKAEQKGEDIIDVMNTFKQDLSNVQVIISHNLPFHIRTLQVECFKTCTYINFNDYILIDTINFYHDFEYPRLRILAKNLLNKDFSKKSPKFNLAIIKKVFLKLYSNYEKKIENEKKKYI